MQLSATVCLAYVRSSVLSPRDIKGKGTEKRAEIEQLVKKRDVFPVALRSGKSNSKVKKSTSGEGLPPVLHNGRWRKEESIP